MADSDEFSVEVNKALDFLAERGFSRCLREEQKSSLQQLWRGGDLMAVLPTGFGKSLIFQLLVLTRKEACVLVICPLKSIIQDQILEATSMGISAGSLSDCNLLDIENGKFQLLFGRRKKYFRTRVSFRPSRMRRRSFTRIWLQLLLTSLILSKRGQERGKHQLNFVQHVLSLKILLAKNI